MVGVAHDPQLGIAAEVVGPLLHLLENLGFDLGVRGSIICQLEKSVGKGSAGKFAVHGLAAVLE